MRDERQQLVRCASKVSSFKTVMLWKQVAKSLLSKAHWPCLQQTLDCIQQFKMNYKETYPLENLPIFLHKISIS